MPSRPNVVVIGGGIGGLFAANALIAHGLRVSVYEQASALGEVGAGVFVTPNAVRQLERVGLGPAVEKWGARVGPASRRIFVMTGRRSRRSRWRTAPAGTRPSACTAPTSSISSPPTCPSGPCIPATVPSAASRTTSGPASNSPTAPASRPTSWSPPTASTPRCARASARPRGRSFTAPFPIEAWWRASACRTGRWIAGRCGPVRRGTSWSFRSATQRWSITSASCRPTRK